MCRRARQELRRGRGGRGDPRGAPRLHNGLGVTVYAAEGVCARVRGTRGSVAHEGRVELRQGGRAFDNPIGVCRNPAGDGVGPHTREGRGVGDTACGREGTGPGTARGSSAAVGGRKHSVVRALDQTAVGGSEAVGGGRGSRAGTATVQGKVRERDMSVMVRDQ